MANGLKCKTCGEELHPADGAAMCKCRVCGTIQLVPAGDAKEQAKPEQQKAVRERPDERIEPEKTGRKEDSRHPVQQREYAHRKHAGKKSKPHPEDGIRKIKTFTSYTEAGREAENRLQVQSGERTGTQEEGQRPAGAGHRPETVEAWRKDKRQEERRKKIGRIVPALSVIAVLAVCGYLVVTNLLQPENESNREQIAVSGIMPAETNAASAAATPAPEERQPTEQEINYSKAEEYLAEGDLFEARKYYQLAEGFSDAVQKAKDIDAYIQAETKNSEKAAEDTNPDESHEEDPDAAKETEYLAALELIMKGERLEAETILEGLSGWKNADEKLEQLREDIADLAAQAGDYDTAIAYYNKLENRTDAIIAKLISANKGKNYRDGMAALASGDLDTANAKLIAAEGFQDAADQLNKLNTYRKANAALAESRYREARADYLQLGEYLDAAEHLETCNAALYREAAERKENGDNTGAYELFSLISGYSDSGDIAAQMDADYEAASDHIENGELVEAESLLAGLTGWKDVDGKLEQLREDIADQAAEAEDYDTAIAYYNKLNNKTEAIEEKIITATWGKNYREAMAALASGDLDTAEAKLIAAENFRDAAEQLDKLNTYRKAGNALAEGRYREARVDYLQLEEYLDAAAHLETCNAALYREAAGLKASGDNTGAYELFSLISGYSDSGDIAAQMDADYEAASAHIENGELVEAEPLLAGLTGWKDVDGKLEQLREDIADRAAEAGDYDTAIAYYNKLSSKTEAIAEKLSVAVKAKNYREGMAALASGDLDTANTKLTLAEDYQDAANQLSRLTAYQEAAALKSSGAFDEAVLVYTGLGEYLDSAEQVNACLYGKAAALKSSGAFDEAVLVYTGLGEYLDSAEQVSACLYGKAEALLRNGMYEEAASAFEALGDYADAARQVTEARYRYAKSLYDAGDYTAAYAAYKNVKGYQDTDELLATDENLVKVKLALYTTAGNIVTFGSYEQDNDLTNGPEKIEWIVLESRNGKVLLLSRYGLDAKPYDTKKTKITWEKCSLRAWLNDEFFRAAFSAEEQDAIVTANVSNSQSQGYWRSNGGNDTQDRVFLLSYAEARQYLGVTYKNTQNERSRTSPTAYAIAQGAETSSTVQTDDGQPVGIWWLRSPGLNEQSAAHVHNGGSLYYRAAGSASVMVRPVIMLDLASVQ